ncbi:Nsp1-like C-terminal region-domain-containing protein [Russula earlei]|uniref:Nsp1-like C-terminal region-domain-containing protein n=1 Tax=Russula earlei TaxID=71964 RepID=A0ACC0UPM8_9AGAM|nr:Nsp1-like C-terminal region-domain-containing protein [Russula earlei]
MSTNFGAGQGIFGGASNQNQNQTTPNPGSTPVASGNPFGNLGVNTTNISAFGGTAAGAGNTPGAPGTSGTTGNTFGPGGSVFGSGGNLYPGASTPAGAGANSPFGGGLFGSNPGTSGSTAGSALFGNTTATNAAATGASGNVFGFPKPVAPGGGLFGSGTGGTTPASGGSTTGSTTAVAAGTSAGSNTLGSLFGNTKPADNTTKPANPPCSGSSLFSGLAPKPSETSTSSAPSSTLPGSNVFKTSTMGTTQAASAQPVFNLSGPATTGEKAASTLGISSGGLFGNLGAAARKDGKPEERKDGASTPSNVGIMSTTSAISVPPPSMLKGKSIEEIINRWSNELEAHVREFNKFATEVAVWDRSLIENGNNLAALYSHVLAAEREQNDIDQSLDHIEQQEKELTATVEMYEKQMADILGGQGGTLRTLDTGPADTERDKNYMLATELHNHLDDLLSSLTQLIESVNSLSVGQGEGKTVSSDDPMAQISQVLSNHLESLQWIDAASRELEEKVVEVEKRVKDVGSISQGAPGLGGGSRSRGFGLNR